MKDLMKALWVLLQVASDRNDHLDSEELQSQIDMCDGFLTQEEITFLTENSVLGVSADTEYWEKVIWDRFQSL
jgi:hypothetical protein